MESAKRIDAVLMKESYEFFKTQSLNGIDFETEDGNLLSIDEYIKCAIFMFEEYIRLNEENEKLKILLADKVLDESNNI